MLKLAKYLKPFIGLILAAVVLLFVQAMADLALPDYMSKIVNNGIQQGGIENAVPEAIRESQMEKLVVFMSENEKKEALDSYIRMDQSSVDYDQYVQEYPTLANEPVYVLKEIDQTRIDRLNPVMGKAFLAVAGVEKMKEENLSAEQQRMIGQQMNEESVDLGDNMIVQAAASAIKAEYAALGMNTEQIQNRYIFRMGFLMLGISLISAVAIVLVGFLSARTAAGLAQNLRRLVFTKVEYFSKAELDQFSTASLITRSTNDITQIQTLLVMMIRMVIYAPILGIGGIIKVIDRNTSMSWIIGVAVIVLLILIASVFVVALPKFKLIQKLIDRLNLVTRENLSGMMVIRAFNTQLFEEKRFDQANQDLTRTNLFVNRVMAVMFPSMMLIMNGVVLVIVWVGAHQIANASMQVGDMMAFMQYAMQIIMAFLMMSFMFIMIPRASVSAQRIVEVLEIEPTIKDPVEPKEFKQGVKGVVEFQNVSFRYQGAEEDMLKNISFKALPGQTTAFIGSTGSGKTTLVNLIPRFYDVTDGRILVDGVDVREITQQALREKIGYVPQKSALLSGTIASNLRYAKEEATNDEILEAVEISQAMEFISDKPQGLDSEISQGGSNISGGQKQRLAIARALVKKAEIYIFDDSFSALDYKTDAALRKALQQRIATSAILLVGQRVSTIMNADQIIVLNEGKIVCQGTHKELMKNCATYQEIALSQLSKEELA